MANLITTGTSATAWVDVTVNAGTPRTLFIKPGNADGVPPSSAVFQVAHKDVGGTYAVLYSLTAGNAPSVGQIVAGGTFGVRRLASAVAAGLDIEG